MPSTLVLLFTVVYAVCYILYSIYIIIPKCACVCVCVCVSVCLCRFYLKTVNGNDLILFAT